MRDLERGIVRRRTAEVAAMMRRIGQGKAALAADYAAQLPRSAGKVGRASSADGQLETPAAVLTDALRESLLAVASSAIGR